MQETDRHDNHQMGIMNNAKRKVSTLMVDAVMDEVRCVRDAGETRTWFDGRASPSRKTYLPCSFAL